MAQDAKGAQANAGAIQLKFDEKDVDFWLIEMELQLKTAGVKSQWLKRQMTTSRLPTDLRRNLKDILSKDETNAGATPYKTLMDRLLYLYGPRPDEIYRKS